MMKKEKQMNSYLTFKLGNEDFALHVNKVQNILEMTNITEVPKAPKYMKGVINLRGMVLPVIDSRLKFGLSETNYTDNTCIIVMELSLDNQIVLVGSIVDEVLSVIEVDSNEIHEAPNIGSKYQAEFINGMIKIDDKFIMILNMEMIFTLDELIELKEENSLEVEAK